MRARTQPLTAKMQDSLGNRLRYLPAVTLAAAGRSGSVSGVSVTRQGWHMALTGSEETSTTDGVSDVSLPHTSSLQSNRYVRRILPTNFPRGFRCSDFKSNCTDSSSSNALTYQQLAIQSRAYPMSKDRGICQSMTSLALTSGDPFHSECRTSTPSLP